MARLSAASRLSSTTRMRSRAGGDGVADAAPSGTGPASPPPAAGRRTTNSLPWPGPSLLRLDAAAVHLDQPLGPASGRCPARPASAPARGRTCVNISKMRGSMSAGDADAGVPHARPPPRSPCRSAVQPDVAAPLGVLGGVVEQVGEHLGQPGRVAVETDRLRRAARRSARGRPASIERAAGLDGAPGRTAASSIRLAAQLDLAAG